MKIFASLFFQFPNLFIQFGIKYGKTGSLNIMKIILNNNSHRIYKTLWAFVAEQDVKTVATSNTVVNCHFIPIKILF